MPLTWETVLATADHSRGWSHCPSWLPVWYRRSQCHIAIMTGDLVEAGLVVVCVLGALMMHKGEGKDVRSLA